MYRERNKLFEASGLGDYSYSDAEIEKFVAEAIEKDKTSELPGDVGKRNPVIVTSTYNYKPNFTGLLNETNKDHIKLQKYDNSGKGLLK